MQYWNVTDTLIEMDKQADTTAISILHVSTAVLMHDKN